jgi:hypothetical protein
VYRCSLRCTVVATRCSRVPLISLSRPSTTFPFHLNPNLPNMKPTTALPIRTLHSPLKVPHLPPSRSKNGPKTGHAADLIALDCRIYTLNPRPSNSAILLPRTATDRTTHIDKTSHSINRRWVCLSYTSLLRNCDKSIHFANSALAIPFALIVHRDNRQHYVGVQGLARLVRCGSVVQIHGSYLPHRGRRRHSSNARSACHLANRHCHRDSRYPCHCHHSRHPHYLLHSHSSV